VNLVTVITIWVPHTTADVAQAHKPAIMSLPVR
jgi:hypothetical protein